MSEDAVLYDCEVTHVRHVAPRRRFAYRLFYLLVDIDRLGELQQRLRLFSHNRFNLLSLHDVDHGSRRPGDLRAWAEGLLARAGIDLGGGRIRLLCLPRVLGFAFNPLSLWYCEDRDGRLGAVIAEVRNTFGERHSYLLQAPAAATAWPEFVDKDKCFHVSPFLDLDGRYRFRLQPPEAQLRVAIHETQGPRAILGATLAGRREAMTDAAALLRVLRMPWATLKVVAAIHWEALWLWLRGASVRTKPPSPPIEVS